MTSRTRQARGPRPGTLLRLAATGGRADGIRIELTAFGSAAASFVLLLAFAVVSIGPDNGPYRLDVLQQSGLHPGVVVALVLLCIPILTFVGQCSRIGAPARDRRLAALRMAGGTPSDVRRIVALETGIAALLGSLVGGMCYLGAHLLWGAPAAHPGTASAHSTPDGIVMTGLHAPGGRLLPLDVIPHVGLIVIALLLVPTAATAGAVAALRHTAITPFGVIHRDVHRPPSITPAIVFVLATAVLAAWQGLFALLPDSAQDAAWIMPISTLPLFLLTLVALIFGSASVAYQLGRLIAPRTRRPALLIAARRMISAPYTASRSTTAVILAVLLGAAVQGTRTAILLDTADSDDPFYANAFDLLNLILVIAIALACASLVVVAAEGIVTRRRTLAALNASGTPRHTLAWATLWETVLPLVPTTILATAAGALAARGLFGASVDTGSHRIPVPVPWAHLGMLATGTVLLASIVTATSLIFLPRSTSVTELRTAA